MIFVTRPDLPELNDLIPYLERLWHSRVLTNGGEFHNELESSLCKYLGVKHISLFNNATTALLVSLKALEITGSVITTPYSFVATSHSLLWNGLNPIFVDISRTSFNIDVEKIENAITEDTSCILAVHCYGEPCETERIASIADKHNLKVIYDAAHAFGVRKNDQSILNSGDLSVLSFHATKSFNTFEGGAIISHDITTKQKVDSLRNFGFQNEVTVSDVGINGKMNELNAIIGLLNLDQYSANLQKRAVIANLYNIGLLNINGISIPSINSSSDSNHSYYPILVNSSFKLTRDGLYDLLKKEGVFARRYFYPLISSFPMYSKYKSSAPDNLLVANLIANQILCLPIYPSLEKHNVERIIQIIRDIH
jgi:dTDP-4-amino-4,6-dideoxygalactose transaminase